jgi:hypothetical protein
MSLPNEEATYRAKAVGALFGMSSNGNPQLAIQCVVVDHDHYAGESIAAILNFTPKSVDRSIESLGHFGFASDDLEQLADIGEARAAELLPNVVELVCAPEEYNGEWNLKVKWVNRPGAGRFAFRTKLEGGDLKQFAASMKGALRNARGGAPRAKQNGSGGSRPVHPNAPGGRPDDDIPF